MVRPKNSSATPRLWNEYLSAYAVRLSTLTAVLGVAVTIVSLAGVGLAQAPAAPAVRVQRDYQLGGRVWPVDLNRDGITDLVSTSPRGLVQVSIGNGDGAFRAPVESSIQGEVLTAADFNGDQRPDVVVSSRAVQTTTFLILPGTGTANLGSPVSISSAEVDFVFALSADFDGDGKRDLVLPSSTGLNVYPGNGNFTFDAPTALVTNGSTLDGIAADLNKDGRIDLVTANSDTGTISIFLNPGGQLFTPSDLHSSHNTQDVTVADVDRDGSIDLLVAAGTPNSNSGFGEGVVLVFRGRGDGTFAVPVEYPVPTEMSRSWSATSTVTACSTWPPATVRRSL